MKIENSARRRRRSVKVKRLPREAKEILNKWYPDIDLDAVLIKKNTKLGNFFAKLFGAAAITVGKTIHLTKYSFFHEENPTEVAGLALLIHELKHIEQQKEMGVFLFYFRYIFIYFPAVFLRYCWKEKTLNIKKALMAEREWGHPLETSAFEIEKKFLENPENPNKKTL